MNEALSQLAADVGLDEAAATPLRLAFGLACASRVEHLLEEPRALACLAALREFVAGAVDAAGLQAAAQEIAEIARSHRGSGSIDGSAHAAVSATGAVAHALAGRALVAADYAAYATVYAYGGYAVGAPSAFEPEHAWQLAQLKTLATSFATKSPT